MLFLLIAVLFVGVVAIAITLAASTSNNVVHFKTVVAHDAQHAIKQVQDLVNKYTKYRRCGTQRAASRTQLVLTTLGTTTRSG